MVKKYQEFVLKRQFARFYSNISQAYLRAYNDNGMKMTCYYALHDNGNLAGWNGNSTPCYNEGGEVLKYLKIIKQCRYLPEENICMKYHQKIFSNFKFDYYYFLNDGTVIITPLPTYLLQFAVDLNGEKGPNMLGYDIFMFVSARKGFTKDQFYIAPYPNHKIEAGGKSTKEMLESLNK